MRRYPPLTREKILSRLSVDMETGIARWVDATKHHRNLVGEIAGHPRKGNCGKYYWVIKIDGIPYRRSQIVLFLKTDKWPVELVDHENGDSLDDRPSNLRHATTIQNAWNHKTRRKKSELPMGVRQISGRYQARIACNSKTHYIGCFDTPEEASNAYQSKRKELFGEFA